MRWDAGGAARGLAILGLGLTTVTTLLAGGFAPAVLGFVVWAAVPYGLVLILSRVLGNDWALVTGAMAVLIGEIYFRAEVFLFPRGSTAALALLFSPLYLSVVALPAGLALGWLLGRLWGRTGRVGRTILAAALAAIVVVGVVAYVRPAFLPGPAARLVSARERIGPPRIVTGDGALSKVHLAKGPAWYQVGAFAGADAGDVVAAIDGSAVVLLDPATGAARSRIPLSAEVRRRWNWFSRLVPNGPELLVAQSGGGYQEVAVLDLTGQTRWSFRPDPSLPPIALLPADLDADGRPELYSASLGTIFRLDVEGRVVWRRSVPGLVHSLDVAPAGGGQPGLVAAVTSARHIHLFTAAGVPRGTLPLGDREEAYRFTFVDWPGRRALVGGVERLTVLDLEGRLLLQYPLGDFRFHEARAVRLDDDPAPHLAVVAAGPREAGRSRLLVFSSAGAVVYDEILAGGGGLLIARDPAGRREALLLAGDGLWRYRR